MKKEKAIEILRRQLDHIEIIKSWKRFSPEFKKWNRDTRVAIENIFGKGTDAVRDFTVIYYSLRVHGPSTSDSEYHEAFCKGLDEAASVLKSQIDEVKEYWEDEMEIQPSEMDYLSIVEKICNRFHLVARQLRDRHNDRTTLDIEDEYDVQDLFRALLAIDFDDIRPEEYTPSYAGSSSRVDFLLKQEQIVIEIKKARKGLRAKEIGEQLIIDIEKYKTHPDCRTLVCFVYDPVGITANPRGIENDLSGQRDELNVIVTIAPQ